MVDPDHQGNFSQIESKIIRFSKIVKNLYNEYLTAMIVSGNCELPYKVNARGKAAFYRIFKNAFQPLVRISLVHRIFGLVADGVFKSL